VGDGCPTDSLLIFSVRAVYRWLEAFTLWQLIYWLAVRLLSGPSGDKWSDRSHGRIRRFMHNEGRWHARYLVGDLYVVAWTVGVAFLVQSARNQEATHGSGAITTSGRILVIVAVYRLYEIFLTQLRIVASDTFGEYEHTKPSIVRYLLFIPLYFFQAALIFAVLYLVAAPTAFTTASGAGITASQFVYLSWTTITTLGSGFTPTTHGAELLQMAEVAEGWLLAGIGLAVFVGSVKIRRGFPDTSLEARVDEVLARTGERDRVVREAALMSMTASGRLIVSTASGEHRVSAMSIDPEEGLTFHLDGAEERVQVSAITEFRVDAPK
jgi:hypothetical protein